MFSPAVCHQKLLEIVHREEVKVNWILSAKVEFLNSEKGPRDRCKLEHFTPFKKDAKKWRENGENLVSNVKNRWSVLVEGRTLRMLMWVVSLISLQVVSKHIWSQFRFKRNLDEKIRLKCFRLRNTFCDYLFKRNVEEATGPLFRTFVALRAPELNSSHREKIFVWRSRDFLRWIHQNFSETSLIPLTNQTLRSFTCL